MKKLLFFISLAFLGLSMANAQPGQGMRQGQGPKAPGQKMGRQGNGQQMISNLTEEQKSAIKDLRLDHAKEMSRFKNEMAILKAQNKSLSSADNIDKKAIDKNIDQQTALINSMMKTQAAHRNEVRGLLTDEQKVFFDHHQGRMGMNQGGRNMRARGNSGMGAKGFSAPRPANCPFR